jgi:cytochrome P450
MPTATFDLGDPALVDDPYPTFAAMREGGQILPGGPGQWIVPRYADVAALLKDPRLTKNLPEAYYRFSVGGDPALSAFLSAMNLGHRNRLASRVLAKAFSPSLVRALSAHMLVLVDELLEPGLDRGTMDAVQDLALPFPMRVICELLGIPAADRAQVWPRAADLVRAFSDVAFLADKDVSVAADALRWLREYLHGLLDQRRDGSGTDLLSLMVAIDDGGERLTAAEIVDNAITVFYAGFETSMGMVSNGIVALLRNPAELARLRADPGLVPAAVEEMLRYEAPIQITMRSPTEAMRIGDRVVRPGRVLFLLLGSANRDGSRFPDPDRFDVAREPNPQLSFGAGVYRCMAAALARAEGAAVLDRLLARCAGIALAGEPVRRPRLNFRTYDRVPLALRPA